MREPFMQAEYEIPAHAPRDLLAGLAELGMRPGDSVSLYADGRVAFGRELSVEESREAARCLRRLSPSGVDHPVLRQATRAHLTLV